MSVTDHVRGEGIAISIVCPPVCFHSSLSFQLTFELDFFACLSVMTIARSRLTESQGHLGQGQGLWLGRGSVRRGAAVASGSGGVQLSSACGRGNAVGLTSILDGGPFFS